MNDLKREKLGAEQDILMEMYAEVEADPERFGGDFQDKLNCFDNRAEYVRGLLEGRWEHEK